MPTPAATPAPAPAAPAVDSKELETFLVNFVVEHTGYPAEIVEMDADLEADLGIDSIKKAQLFGELGEYFDVEPSEDLSLDDFPTLRHVLNFLVQSQVGVQTPTTPSTPDAPVPAPAVSPAAQVLVNSPVATPSVSQPQADAPSAFAPTPVSVPPTSSGVEPQALEQFLVNFVVEHTGYPAEIVEMDADLEADLGIDSIKKAQLFGELGEYFDVQPSEDLSLDDFPTLRHVMNFLIEAQSCVPEPAGTTPAADRPAALEPTDIKPATLSPVPTQPQAAAPAPPVAAQVPDSAAATTAALDPQGLESFLVNFVVEHTGYPAEIVELDADLEADLGIDSIKKAQLFGELGEYFDVQPSEDLSLDDFPTLRHVLNFLVTAQGGASATGGSPPQSAHVGATDTPAYSAPPSAPATAMPPVNAPVEPAAPVEPDTPAATVSDSPPPAAADAGTMPSLDSQQLEDFLVNFVVEHTGYPTEIVELDADLEADLGIDSIKKAQLFGELGEYFDVQPSEDLSLDDFPTLRHVLNFLLQAQDLS